MSIHFIADLHLGEHTPARNMLLMKTLVQWVGNIEALYVLGGFFAAWLGDDDRHHVNEELSATLKAFAATTPIYMQHGSGDFLLGQAFAERTGVVLLPEVAVLQAHGQTALLLHGDSLHTDNTAYVALRQQNRSPEWQTSFLNQSVPERRLMAAHLQQMAVVGEHTQAPSHANNIQALLQQYAPMLPINPTIIHAHSKRSVTQTHPWQGHTATEWALPAWQGLQGIYLALTDQGQWEQHRLG